MHYERTELAKTLSPIWQKFLSKFVQRLVFFGIRGAQKLLNGRTVGRMHALIG